TSLGLTTLVQYWRSFDHLEAYARAPDKHHWPAWVEFNRRMKNSRGDVGIWHETYRVRAGEYRIHLWRDAAHGAGESRTPGGRRGGKRERARAARRQGMILIRRPPKPCRRDVPFPCQ